MKPKIAAVVVTFNRKKLLLECLNALKSQNYPLDAIFIIDGPSTDGTPEALKRAEYIKELPPKEYNEYSWLTENVIENSKGTPLRVVYVRLYEDVGGSGGFHEGVKRAYQEGYDWIWLMDDDAEPKEDALEKMLQYYNIFSLENTVALAPVVKCPDGNICLLHRGRISFETVYPTIQKPLAFKEYSTNHPIEIDFVSFVGPLINREAIKKVGFPRKEFFIHHDDVEYSIRLRKVGNIYLIPNSVIVHKVREPKKVGLMQKKFMERTIYRVPYDKLWKTYYGYRNLTYLGKLYSTNKLTFYLEMLIRWALSIGGVILFDDYKFRRILFITSAYLDGLKGVFDNEKPKRILYGGKKK